MVKKLLFTLLLVVLIVPLSAQEKSNSYTLAVRANLLRWVTLTPDLGVEVKINNRIGLLLDCTTTSIDWKDNTRRYALWEFAPQVRYYIGQNWYAGLLYKRGQFNYNLSDKGKQGSITGGGIVGGYRLNLFKFLSVDFSLGVGYLDTKYTKYRVIEGIRVRDVKENKGWIGPVDAGVTIVCKIF